MTEVTSDPFVRIGAAAAELGVSVETLRSWCDSGRVPCWRTPTGERRIRQSTLDALRTDDSEAVAS